LCSRGNSGFQGNSKATAEDIEDSRIGCASGIGEYLSNIILRDFQGDSHIDRQIVYTRGVFEVPL